MVFDAGVCSWCPGIRQMKWATDLESCVRRSNVQRIQIYFLSAYSYPYGMNIPVSELFIDKFFNLPLVYENHMY